MFQQFYFNHKDKFRSDFARLNSEIATPRASEVSVTEQSGIKLSAKEKLKARLAAKKREKEAQ